MDKIEKLAREMAAADRQKLLDQIAAGETHIDLGYHPEWSVMPEHQRQYYVNKATSQAE
ncbi:hypothetical protein N5J77_12685 [Sphingobium yanoikuyae]|uniref:Uncharacterized protein n=1 Tax=Sphingobium yanoikuyae TaxID=13690 RepID=A0AA43BCP5_SPHYA|nr:hypothetical protein [Sphingobium yanoikuyae]MDH2131982.1 hypothetical protein [Sphingobium yanoikuyae]MDH2150588.1 hypothetical protein [Sphingobium yanoikuyae]MDH2167530.1 hypothetical protein [Sphingobium yanoikuyae]